MTRIFKSLAGISLATMGLLSVPTAQAEIFDFSLPLLVGTATGTVTGTLDLAFVAPGGSGSGAAASLVFTSIPAGFGALAAGGDATAWGNQAANAFTVTAGTITSFEFLAATAASEPADVFCINSSTGDLLTFGDYRCTPGLNELSGPTGDTYGANFEGFAGVTFTEASAATPEPNSVVLVSMLLAAAFVSRKRTARSLNQFSNRS